MSIFHLSFEYYPIKLFALPPTTTDCTCRVMSSVVCYTLSVEQYSFKYFLSTLAVSNLYNTLPSCDHCVIVIQ